MAKKKLRLLKRVSPNLRRVRSPNSNQCLPDLWRSGRDHNRHLMNCFNGVANFLSGDET
jgi:hypothetical protein